MSLGTKGLPHDLEAETAVLGALLISQKALSSIVDKLEPEHFYLDHHAQVYRAVITLFSASKPIDLVTLASELEGMRMLDRVGGQAFLAELQSGVPSAANIEHYAELIINAAGKRRLVSAGARVTALGYDDSVRTRTAFEQAQDAVFRAWIPSGDDSVVTMQEAIEQVWENMSTGTLKKNGLSTGFYDLDKLLGSLRGGNFILIAARPGMGKTSFALNLADYVASKLQTPVGLFSMEMSAAELMTRMVSGRAMVEHTKIQHSTLEAGDWAKIAHAVGEISTLPIFFDETSRLSVVDIRARARRFKLVRSVGLIIVDYLQLMDAPKKESRVQEVTEISRNLKSLARELDVPVVACSQLNREVEKRSDRRPQLSDLRESGALEQDADMVLFLNRPGMYDDSIDPNEAEVVVAKHRNGPTGAVGLVFRPEYVLFQNKANRP